MLEGNTQDQKRLGNGGRQDGEDAACLYPSISLPLSQKRSTAFQYIPLFPCRTRQHLTAGSECDGPTRKPAASLLGFRLSRFLLLWRITININTVVGSEWNWLCSEPLPRYSTLCLRWVSQICSSTTQPGSVYIAVPFATSTSGAGF